MPGGRQRGLGTLRGPTSGPDVLPWRVLRGGYRSNSRSPFGFELSGEIQRNRHRQYALGLGELALRRGVWGILSILYGSFEPPGECVLRDG